MSNSLELSKNIPLWLNENFIAEIFKKSKISNVKLSSATKPGDNFVASVFRVCFDKDDEKNQVILKTPSNCGHEIAHSYLSEDYVKGLFEREMKMYKDVLPMMMYLWKNSGYEDLLCPNLIYQSITPSPIIILEDVSPYGYKIEDKITDDFNVSIMIAERLAKFHASSYYLCHEKQVNFSNFNGNLFDNSSLTDVVYEKGLGGFIHVAREREELREYIDALEKLKDDYLVKMNEIYSSTYSGLKVLTHNDFHLKNILFKKHEDCIENFYIIDYQFCSFTSPAIDLIYALYYFTSSSNRQLHRDEFISIYHHQFVKSLNDFNYCGNLPSLKSIYDEIDKCGCHEILLAICLKIINYFDLSTLTAEELDKGEGKMLAKNRMFSNEDFLNVIEVEMKEFRKRGIL